MTHEANQVKEALRDILSTHEFAKQSPSPLLELWQKFKHSPWFQSILNKIKQWLSHRHPHSFPQVGLNISDRAILVLFLSLACISILVLLYSFYRQKKPRTAGLVKEEKQSEREDYRSRYPENLEREAIELGAKGEFRKAAELLFQASLLLLDRRGLIRFQDSKTHREYERELKEAQDPAVLSHFEGLNELYEVKCFGLRHFSAKEFYQYVEDYEACKIR